jgi:hypothetical protein
MQFLTLVYIDPERLSELPVAEYDRLMRGCFEKADAMRESGQLLGTQQLENVDAARTVRMRDGVTRITDGPFAETREFLAGFNLIEAADIDEAVRVAQQFPWSRFGSIEVRPVRDLQAERDRVATS